MSNSNDMARDRTDWAEDRTIMANERTFAGWMRTGMASIALAVGLRAVFGDAEPVWIAKGVASLFLVTAILIFWSAYRQACNTQARLNDHATDAKPSAQFALLASVFTLGAVVVGVILWAI